MIAGPEPDVGQGGDGGEEDRKERALHTEKEIRKKLMEIHSRLLLHLLHLPTYYNGCFSNQFPFTA
jgi:hypothetical protein